MQRLALRQANGKCPKHALAEAAILRAIRDGHFVPGERLPGERVLAERFGVAPLTLRQAMTRLVSSGVLERRERVGTFVRASAAAPHLGLLVLNVRPKDTAFLPAMDFDILCRAAAPEKREVRVQVLLPPFPSPTRLAREFRAMGVGAVGLLGFYNSDREFVQALSEQIPCVLFNKELPGVALPCAKPDHAEAARLMAEYFAARGRRRVGMAIPSTEHAGYNEIWSCLEGELRRRGMTVDRACWFCGSDPVDYGPIIEWVTHLVSSTTRPDGLVVTQRHVAQHISTILAARGERLGQAMDIISTYSGAEAGRLGDPWPILALNYSAAAEAGAEMLLEIVRNSGRVSGAPVRCATPALVLPQGAASASAAQNPAAERR